MLHRLMMMMTLSIEVVVSMLAPLGARSGVLGLVLVAFVLCRRMPTSPWPLPYCCRRFVPPDMVSDLVVSACFFDLRDEHHSTGFVLVVLLVSNTRVGRVDPVGPTWRACPSGCSVSNAVAVDVAVVVVVVAAVVVVVVVLLVVVAEPVHEARPAPSPKAGSRWKPVAPRRPTTNP